MVTRRLLLLLAFVLLGFAPAQAGDADTLTVGGKVYRLDGIDAPEIDQNCIDEDGVYPCGQLAVEALDKLIADRAIHCDDLGLDPKYPKRRIGRCTVNGIDLHRWLVRNGWALNFEPYAFGRFKDDEREARERGLGMWKGCFVAPRDFRRWNKHTAVLLGPNCAPDARRKLFPTHAVMPPGCEIKGSTPFVRRSRAIAVFITCLVAGATGARRAPIGGSAHKRTRSRQGSACPSPADRIANPDPELSSCARVGTEATKRGTGVYLQIVIKCICCAAATFDGRWRCAWLGQRS
jgi:endonuclease YncB( thermonuclease family)